MRKNRCLDDELLGRRQTASSATSTSDFTEEDTVLVATDTADRIRRTRNPGTPRSKSDLRTLTKSDSYPLWGRLQRLHSSHKEVVPFGKQEQQQDFAVMKRRSSLPGTFRTAKRRSNIGRLLSVLLPSNLSPILQEEEDDDLWFTSVTDFKDPTIVLEESSLRTTYFVRAVVSQRNFVMHVYAQDRLSRGEEKQVRRLVDFMQWLRHPHIIKCVGAWETDTAFYIIEEYCHRANLLQQLSTNRKQFTETFVIERVLRPLLEALVYLHQMNVAHRGIRPENIHFGKSNVLRLTGFVSAIEYTRSRPCSRLGPLDYAPPEMLGMPEIDDDNIGNEDEELMEYDEKIDVWQIGILTYELLSGTCPFEVDDPVMTGCLIEWCELQSLTKEFSPGAIDFIQSALKKQPHMRPSMLDLAGHSWLQPRHVHSPSAAGRRSHKMLTNLKNWVSSALSIPRPWGCLRRLMSQAQRNSEKQLIHESASISSAQDDRSETRLIPDPVVNQPMIGLEVPSILNIDLDGLGINNLDYQCW